MVLLGLGMGFTSAPATESIMGAVSLYQAGVGSAVNDATRELGGTLGVAVVGSVYASLSSDAFARAAAVPGEAAEAARESIGGALVAAERLAAGGGRRRPGAHRDRVVGVLRRACRRAAWWPPGCAAGAAFAPAVLPAQPGAEDEPDLAVAAATLAP